VLKAFKSTPPKLGDRPAALVGIEAAQNPFSPKSLRQDLCRRSGANVHQRPATIRSGQPRLSATLVHRLRADLGAHGLLSRRWLSLHLPLRVLRRGRAVACRAVHGVGRRVKRAVAGVPKRALGINDVRWSTSAAQLKHTYAVPRR
jgi:hypothetical protein